MNGAGGAWRTISVALHADAGQYVATMASAGGVTTKFGDTVDKVTKKSGDGWTSFAKVVAASAVVAGIALAVFIGASIRAAAEFESRMAAVQAVSGATGAEMDSLREKALQLGADTSFSASQAASAMEELVKAGVPVADVLNGAADATVALAAAGEVDLAKAAEISAAAMNQFQMSAEDLPKIADLVAGAANVSAIGVEDFGISLSQVGAVANLTGASFEDTATAITAMGKAGIIGSDAGTSLKTFLQRLVPSTTEAREEMEKLGIVTEDGANRFFDAEGNLRDFDEVAQVLQDSLIGMTREQKLATLQTLFGSDAIRAAAVFAEEGAEGYNTLAEAMGNVSAEDVAEERLDTLAGSVEKFKGSVETLLISSGSTFTKLLKPIVDGATTFVNVLAEDPATLFTGILSTLKPLLPFWHDLVDTGENLGGIFAEAWEQGDGLVATLAQMGGAAIVGGLTAVGTTLESITGFLEDNDWALSLVMASLLGLAGARAWPLIISAIETMYVRWLLFEGSVGSVSILRSLGTIASGFGTMVTSITTGTSMVVGGITSIATASVSSAAIAGGAIAGLAAGYFLATTAMNKQSERSKKRMDEFVASLDIDESKVSGLTRGMDQINTRAQAMVDTATGSNWSDFSQRLTFWNENEIQDAEEQINRANEITDGYMGVVEDQDYINNQIMAVADDLEMPAPDVQDWAEKLNLDPATQTVEEMATAIDDARAAAAKGTPLTDGLAASYETLAENTATATEKVDAWKDAMDRALGVVKNVVDARVDLEASLDDMTATFTENGWATGGLDPNTEGGRANITAASSTVDAAIEWVKAITDEQGISAGADALALVRERIIQTIQSTGVARDEAEEWVNELGLTPDLVETQIDLKDPDNAQGYADDLLDKYGRLNGMKVVISVGVQKASNDILAGIMIAVDEATNRWGGLYSFASGGTTPAHVAHGTRYKWAEPETGGEAFLPRFGDLARSEGIMGTVAGWYGGTYVPRGAASAMAALPQRQPMVAAYQGMSAADVAQIVANMQRPNVAVTTNARTDADPQAISRHTERVLMFGGS